MKVSVLRAKFHVHCGFTVLLVCTGTLLCTGCVRRRMTVRTNPPGAMVSVDNQVIGSSPAATPFTYYATREFRIEADGYETETIRRRFNPPWYQWPGIDFITETLWPGELRDERIIDVTLRPRVQPPDEEVISRAEGLRNQTRSGMVTGLPQ
ncbi:PEGA domain-containing protein [Roseiconus lacunae]|uniref:PEGA domain-containing protein n=1 Tax=Roseiconus lacunae TaxID=2605694 RepID=UPI0011F202C7|nr:PEGA domain-containing protein [Roseiconus lacunae]MCD0462180.1 PEGA domain-containing protein [Roseiconus lacunae]WRQ49032.1 PEGA domain-containing protein [Stieleria sp. HD01]